MRNTGMSKLQYLLYALLMFALTGCGASTLGTTSNAGPGSISAKLVWGEGKSTAKTVALPAGVDSIQVTVTGTDAAGNAIPVVRGTINTTTNQGTIGGVSPGTVTLAVKALSGATVSYEGYAISVVVNAGVQSDAGTIVMSPPLVKAQDAACVSCHETTLDRSGQNLVADFKQSGHYTNLDWSANAKNGVTGTGCAGCHGPQHNDTNPAASGRCYECHGAVIPASHRGNAVVQNGCNTCHYSHNPLGPFVGGRCIACHALPQNANASGSFVNDNNGVRAITTEFTKWSHHVTGVALNDAHCAACHLEGKVSNGNVVVDLSKHMVDAKTHLRDTTNNTDADFAWDPAAPSFSGMDTFCMSCHDANGATSPMSAQIQAFINSNGLAAAGKTASATNPFGDTISNQYDKLERPAVVDAASQFATSNPSHHAVRGQKYTGRTRAAGPRQIANVAAFTSNSSATLPGARSTIYDAGKFQADYTTLADAAGESGARNGGSTLGDDSTLHCADCHTVGQYRAADVGTRYNNAVIGAHGANNEYLLRNNAGTDARHQGVESTTANGPVTGYGTKPYLVCFNCHAFTTYGTTAAVSGAAGNSHAGEYSKEYRCNGPYNTVFGNMTGEARLRGTNTTAGANYGKASNTFGNVFGIQCNNCHNSGVGANMFGGIHGAKQQTYTDGMGNTTKHRRFLPGLGNTMFVPGVKGGFTGGSNVVYAVYSGNRNGTGTGNATGQTFTQLPVRTIIDNVTVKTGSYEYVTGGVSSDLNWEQKTAQSVAGEVDLQSKAMGCYTLSPPGSLKLTAAANGRDAYAATEGQKGPDGREMFDVWGGCDDHNGAQGAGTSPVRKVLRKTDY